MTVKRSKTQIKVAALSASELHLFRALHAELDAAHERLAHEATRARLQALEHEAAALRLSSARNAAERHSDARMGERKDDVAAAKARAVGLAEQLARDYAVDLTRTAIDPVTGAFIPLTEDRHGS